MILMLAGTSDARELAIQIKQQGHELLTTVVTDNAALALRDAGLMVQVGRLTDEDLVALIREKSIQAIVDGSHPYAEEASKNAIQAAEHAEIPYIRYEREQQSYVHEKLHLVANYEEAAELALQKKGVIMLTTGSKTLQVFTNKLLGVEGIELIARMLPRLDNMEKCEALGFPQKNIVAMQGPFSKELNTALYNQFGVTLMITKESGKVGSVDEKVEAALELGIETIMIERPKLQYKNVHSSFTSVLDELQKLQLTK